MGPAVKEAPERGKWMKLDSGFPPARLAPVPAGKASFFGRDAFGGAGGMGPAVKEAPERGKWMKVS